MKSFVIAIVAALAFTGFALAQGPGWGRGRGPGMMWGQGPYGEYPCPGPGAWWGPGAGGPAWADPQSQALTEENARNLAQQYADKYLKGYSVERVLPFTAMSGRTAYQAELKGPEGEYRILHVNPWGNVVPFGGPQTRARAGR